ncbi:Stf0 family sulfotransferase [Actibacterium sp. D379-3]
MTGSARYDSYVICATPRTGSTLLCGLLASTNAAGKPDSFFRRQSISRWAAHLGVPAPDECSALEFNRAYLAAVLREGRGATGVFGVRLMMENTKELSARLDILHPNLPDDAARFESAFGRTLYIHLSRLDKVAQAISYAKAMQTGLWHVAPDGTEIERTAPPKAPEYDADLLRQHVQKFEAFEGEWNLWFEQQRVAPLRITYESLSFAPKNVLATILRHLGLDPEIAAGVAPGVAKLADEVSLDWRGRYRADWEDHAQP